MTNPIVEPHQLAITLLSKYNINIYDFFNQDGTINKNELSKLHALPDWLSVPIYQSVTNTVNDINKEANSEEEINNLIGLRVANNVSYQILTEIDKRIPRSKRRQQIIKWVPSAAETPDIIHAGYYGKTMTYERARQLELGSRYGCKCAMQFINEVFKIEDMLDDGQINSGA